MIRCSRNVRINLERIEYRAKLYKRVERHKYKLARLNGEEKPRVKRGIQRVLFSLSTFQTHSGISAIWAFYLAARRSTLLFQVTVRIRVILDTLILCPRHFKISIRAKVK